MSEEHDLIPRASAGDIVGLGDQDADRLRAYADASIADSTRRAYSSAWRAFVEWCALRGVSALPANNTMVAAFLAEQAGRRAVATLEKYLAAIGEAHRLAGVAVPSRSREVRTVMKGIRRTHGVAQNGKAPLLVAHLRRISSALPAGPLGTRDRALLLVGFAGALRRSELVGLDRGDLKLTDDGLILYLRRSKTDQQQAGRIVGIPYGSTPPTCPVRAAREWLLQLPSEEEPAFVPVDRHGRLGRRRLSGWAVGQVVKRSVELIGLKQDDFGGHSLRAGLATEAARAGAGEIAIMRQTGHRSVTTLKQYVRLGSLFSNNAAAMVGL